MDIRVRPISSQEVCLQVTCSCGEVRKTEIGEGRPESFEFGHTVIVGAADFELLCRCGKKFAVVVQGNHFHVNEMKAREPF